MTRAITRLALLVRDYDEAISFLPFGTVVVFLDLYGNKWDMIEPHAPGGAAQAGAATDVERNKALVRGMVAAISAQDWPALDGIVAPDFVRHGAAAGEPGVRSRSALVEFLRGELATFPDADETLLDLIAEGDRVAARHRFTGTQRGALGPHPPSDQPMSATYLAIDRIAGGRIVEAWAEWDKSTGLRQLGHVTS